MATPPPPLGVSGFYKHIEKSYYYEKSTFKIK